MKQLWHRLVFILTLKCDEASHLQSDAFDRRLRWYEKLALKGHLLVCSVCRGLHRNLRLLRSANDYCTKHVPNLAQARLSAEANQRIRKRLELESDQNSQGFSTDTGD